MASVLLAGDWHGNRVFAAACFGQAAELGCEAVLQLGDFGLWPGREDPWLDLCDQLASAAATTLVWLDGNHENHAWLAARAPGAGADGLVRLRPRVAWATRGARWQWGGRRFGALGGAVSLDRFARRPGVNWWPEEVPTPSDAERLGVEPLDVLATHDAPAGVGLGGRSLPLPHPILRDARAVRELIQEAVDRTRPSLLVHGHHHRRYTANLGDLRVEGFAHDRAESGATAVLRLGDLAVQDQPRPAL